MKQSSKRATEKRIEERVEMLWRHHTTYGELEALAGVIDRMAFWRGLDEEQGRQALRERIRERVRRGDL